jgi:hypothetical protein
MILDFFRYAKELGITMSGERTLRPRFEDLELYLEGILGQSMKSKDSQINVEQLLTLLEIDLRKRDIAFTRQLRDDTLHVIRTVIGQMQQARCENCDEYSRFVEEVADDDTVITFNWDLLLDNAFGREQLIGSRTEWDNGNHYANFLYHLSGFKETTLQHSTIEAPYTEYDESRGFYLKLHGSVDWFFCQNRDCRAYGRVFPVNRVDQAVHCSECHSSMDVLIVPPVLNKNYHDHPMLTVLWNTAEAEIAAADEVVLWGYSLPPTDFEASWLLRQATEGLEKLVVINPDVVRAGKSPTWNYTFLRRLYEPVKHRVDKAEVHLYKSYADYVAGNRASESLSAPSLANL